jgi:hypothetical protein
MPEIAVTRAWGIEDENNSRNIVWLPKSQCQIDFKVTGADTGPAIITAPEWLLKEKELL